MFNFKKDFSLMVILLMPVAIAINAVVGNIVAAIKIPIYGDQIGTILISVIAGPWVGLVTGVLTNFVNAIFDPTWIPYALVAMAIGVTSGFLSKIGMFRTLPKTIVAGFIIAIIAGLITTPIKAFIFGGASTGGSALVTGAFLGSGFNVLTSVFLSSILTDLADKIASAVLVYMLIKSMPSRYLVKFPYGEQFIKKANKQTKSDNTDKE